ncbi:hypothetical protein Y1Q_0019098 [Alligator mississippiensis]|uniref:Uncharacterized protein n=1 Tax=Alligator mississippiensis TaxID=8496 RepID=A0A151MPY3_ALLMI|nr:hypothetical protein Y1Q_0019098 [Alligator mississippiensis]
MLLPLRALSTAGLAVDGATLQFTDPLIACSCSLNSSAVASCTHVLVGESSSPVLQTLPGGASPEPEIPIVQLPIERKQQLQKYCLEPCFTPVSIASFKKRPEIGRAGNRHG